MLGACGVQFDRVEGQGTERGWAQRGARAVGAGVGHRQRGGTDRRPRRTGCSLQLPQEQPAQLAASARPSTLHPLPSREWHDPAGAERGRCQSLGYTSWPAQPPPGRGRTLRRAAAAAAVRGASGAGGSGRLEQVRGGRRAGTAAAAKASAQGITTQRSMAGTHRRRWPAPGCTARGRGPAPRRQTQRCERTPAVGGGAGLSSVRRPPRAAGLAGAAQAARQACTATDK